MLLLMLATPGWVSTLAAWVALGFLALMGLAILFYVVTGRIDLSGLISEPNGDASMSRFQLLIFTFVIAASLFLIIASTEPTPQFPNVIPSGILVLLGISASSYLVSKGIQNSSPEGLSGRGPQITIKGNLTETKFGGTPVQFQADVTGLSDQSVTWSIDPIDFGEIDANGLYRPPAKGDPTTVTVTAVSKEDVGISDKETVKVT